MIGRYIHGTGTVHAVVLPGWLGDWRVFEPMLPALDPDLFSLAFLDARGYGASRAATGPFDMTTIAADALHLVDDLGWDRFAVVGHSMGGKAALRLALDAPDRVTRILALTPVWAGPAPFGPDTLEFFRSATNDVGVRAAILDQTTGRRLPSVWSRGQAAASVHASTNEAFAAYLESWTLDDFGDAASCLSHETLVVVGEHDAGVTEAGVRATWLSSLAKVRLEILPNAGHYPMIEAPLALAALFERFLAEVSDRGQQP
jgi:pimeloyl-ACP methyl ester carboxylesterase